MCFFWYTGLPLESCSSYCVATACLVADLHAHLAEKPWPLLSSVLWAAGKIDSLLPWSFSSKSNKSVFTLRQNKNNKKNPFILKGYRRHPKPKQQQKTPYIVAQIEAVEHRSIQLFIVISGITSVGSAALYTLLSVRLRSRSQPSNSQEHVNETCLIFLGESASQHRHSIPGCHTKLSVSVDTYNRVETTPERHLPL